MVAALEGKQTHDISSPSVACCRYLAMCNAYLLAFFLVDLLLTPPLQELMGPDPFWAPTLARIVLNYPFGVLLLLLQGTVCRATRAIDEEECRVPW